MTEAGIWKGEAEKKMIVLSQEVLAVKKDIQGNGCLDNYGDRMAK
jgi:hypothetical protein